MAGQPTLYKPEYDEQAYKLALLGHTDAEMGTFFGVTETTINNWKNAHPSFFESIKKGKDIADADITESLYKRAKGFEKASVKIFNNQGAEMIVPFQEYYPPDPTSMIFWLKNRQPKKWRDKQHIEEDNKAPAVIPEIKVYIDKAPPLAGSEDEIQG